MCHGQHSACQSVQQNDTRAMAQVIEARNLSTPGGNVGPFGLIDAYTAASLETEAGVMAAHTPAERRNLTQPKWQHNLAFPDAALSHSVTFAVSGHRRLSSSTVVGQVRAPKCTQARAEVQAGGCW